MIKWHLFRCLFVAGWFFYLAGNGCNGDNGGNQGPFPDKATCEKVRGIYRRDSAPIECWEEKN